MTPPWCWPTDKGVCLGSELQLQSEWSGRKGKKEQNLRQAGQRQVTAEAKCRAGATLWTTPGRVRVSESPSDRCLSSGEVTDDRHRCTSSFLGRLLV